MRQMVFDGDVNTPNRIEIEINLQTRVRRIQKDILLSTTSQIMREMRKQNTNYWLGTFSPKLKKRIIKLP
jgi:hypothetical protein